jgi:hypothetical protein
VEERRGGEKKIWKREERKRGGTTYICLLAVFNCMGYGRGREGEGSGSREEEGEEKGVEGHHCDWGFVQLRLKLKFKREKEWIILGSESD